MSGYIDAGSRLKVWEQYPSLYHYTDGGGLHGILTSGCLRASHIRYLNDEEEFEGYLDRRLSRFITDTIEAELVKPAALHQSFKDALAAAHSAEELACDLAVTALNALRSMNDWYIPFITSFCGHRQPALSQHGLLSQWRGYGADGGYAIEFDTRELDEQLSAFMAKWASRFHGISPIDYRYVDPDHQSSQVKNWEVPIAQFVLYGLRMGAWSGFAPVHDPMVLLQTMTKHESFSEEDEVRLVVCLPNREKQKIQHYDNDHLKIEFVNRRGLMRPYITLFGGKKLPVKRIIVGPHPQMKLRQQAAEFMVCQLGYDTVSVQLSEIPFRGP
jgi:hypothetical protein